MTKGSDRRQRIRAYMAEHGVNYTQAATELAAHSGVTYLPSFEWYRIASPVLTPEDADVLARLEVHVRANKRRPNAPHASLSEQLLRDIRKRIVRHRIEDWERAVNGLPPQSDKPLRTKRLLSGIGTHWWFESLGLSPHEVRAIIPAAYHSPDDPEPYTGGLRDLLEVNPLTRYAEAYMRRYHTDDVKRLLAGAVLEERSLHDPDTGATYRVGLCDDTATVLTGGGLVAASTTLAGVIGDGPLATPFTTYVGSMSRAYRRDTERGFIGEVAADELRTMMRTGLRDSGQIAPQVIGAEGDMVTSTFLYVDGRIEVHSHRFRRARSVYSTDQWRREKNAVRAFHGDTQHIALSTANASVHPVTRTDDHYRDEVRRRENRRAVARGGQLLPPSWHPEVIRIDHEPVTLPEPGAAG